MSEKFIQIPQFSMMFDNVLDESLSDKVEFRNCKLRYLQTQNKLLTIQLDSVCKLVDLHKQILNITTGKQEVQVGTIEVLLQTANKMIQQCYKECQDALKQKRFDGQGQQGLITPDFFMELVVSFETTIKGLKQQIHHRQNLLQQLEANKSHPKKRQFIPEGKALTKAIESYDIYPRISQKCREQIRRLKMLKQQENKEKQKTKSVFKQLSNSNTSCLNQADRTIKIKPKTSSPHPLSTEKTLPILPLEQMSPFEKIILIYKKKKLFNDILENKVIALKNKIQQKEIVNKLLRARAEKQIWELGDQKVHIVDDGDATFLSVLNQTLKAKNLDFSVDFSRVQPEPWRQEEKEEGMILEGLSQEEICNFTEEIKQQNEDQD